MRTCNAASIHSGPSRHAAGGAHVSGPTDQVQDFYTLGGLFNLSGLAPDEISGPHFGILRGIYYRRIGSGPEGLFDVPTYLGFSAELGNVWQRRGDASVDSALFNSMIDSNSNADFVDHIYQNVVGQTPTASDRDFYVKMLQGDGGTLSQAELLILAANSVANEIQINLVGLSQTGVEFSN